MANYNFSNSVTFQYDIDTTNDAATLGSATGSGIVLGTGDDTIYFGGQDQSATAGDGTGTPGADTFVFGTDGASSPTIVAYAAAAEFDTATITGGGANNNTVMIEGGTKEVAGQLSLALSSAVILSDDFGASNIANIVVGNSSTYLIDQYYTLGSSGSQHNITVGDGNNYIVLDNGSVAVGYGADTLTVGNGNNTVYIDPYASNDIVSLGSGLNVVYIEQTNQITTQLRNEIPIEEPDISHFTVLDEINGGSGASNTLIFEINTGAANMGPGIVGFETVEFQFSSSAALTTNETDETGKPLGMVVDGTALGNDTIVLEQSNQSYIGNSGWISGPAYGNTVTLTSGSINSGVTLDGGAHATLTGSVLELESATGVGDYVFAAATVENFTTVDLFDTTATLTLNSASYDVEVESSSLTPLLNITGGAGTNIFDISGGSSSAPEVFSAGSVLNGGAGASESLLIGDRTASDVDLSNTSVTNFTSITIEEASSLTLTNAQIASLDTFVVGKGIDPNGLFVAGGESLATLVVDVTPGTTNLNVASLELSGFEGAGGVVEIVDANSTNDTIYGGPGNETIDLAGAGNYWVNAGSGNDTILVGQNSGTASVLIGGNTSGIVDRFEFGTSSTAPLVTGDVVVGPTAGSGVVEITSGTVDLTHATFENFSASDTVLIDAGATAIFTIEQLAMFSSEGVHITDPAATLEIIGDKTGGTSSTGDVITSAELSGFTGNVLLDVTGASVTNVAPVLIDVSALSNPTTIEAENNTAFWSGSWTINGGSDTTVVFDNPGGVTINPLLQTDSVHGITGGTYIFDVDSNLDISAVSTSFIAATGPVNVEFSISQGETLVVNAAQISGGYSGAEIYDASVNPTSNAHLVVDLSTGSAFSQSNVIVDTDPNASIAGYYFDETINVSVSGSTINLTGQGSNAYLITVNEDNASAPETILAGLGPEDLYGSSGADTFVFDVVDPSSPTPFSIVDVINGELGSNTLDVGQSTEGEIINDSFVNSTISGVQQFTVFTSATGVFTSTQLDGHNVTVASGGDLVVHVTEGSGLFSLTNVNTSNVSANANFNLANSGATILIDNMASAGNSIYGGSGAETIYDGQPSDNLYAGVGTDTIDVRDGASGMDNLFGNASGTGLAIDFTFDGGSASHLMTGLVNDPASYWHEGGTNAPTMFYVQNGTINGENETSTSIAIDADVDFSGASISGLTSSTTITLALSTDAVFTVAELTAFSSAGDVFSGAGSNGIVIDVATGSLSPTTASALDLGSWDGAVTIDAFSSDQTIDASGFFGAGFDGLDGQTGGVSIFGGAGDTIIGSGNSGDYIQGGGASTTIIIHSGGDDYVAAGAGNGNTIEFLSSSATTIDAAGDTIRGGGGTGETILIGANVEFDGNPSFVSLTAGTNSAVIQSIDDISFSNSGSSNYTAEFNYGQIVHDELSLTAQNPSYELAITDLNPTTTTAHVTFEVLGTGTMDLRSVVTTGFGANDQGGGAATVDVYDNNTGSVTVYGTENGVASPGTEAGDLITVQGHGDSIVLGSGANLADFLSLNAANDVQLSFANLNTGNAASAQSLGAMGNLVEGLADGAGYADLSGYGLTTNASAVTSSSGIDLGSANGFAKFGIIEDTQVVPGDGGGASGSGEEFLHASGTAISGAGVQAAALQIEENFTDASHAAVSGFMTAADGHGDVALFYVSTTGSGPSNTVAATDIHLVGVFEAAQTVAEITAASGAISSSFFHIH